MKKVTKKCHICVTTEELTSHTWRQDSKPLRLIRKPPTTRLVTSHFEKKINFQFSEIFFEKKKKKNTNNVTFRELQRFEQPLLNAKIKIPVKILTEPHYRDKLQIL